MKDEPAFPYQHDPIAALGAQGRQQFPGLTKRELFAAMAMQGIFASGKWGKSTDETAELAWLAANSLLAIAERE